MAEALHIVITSKMKRTTLLRIALLILMIINVSVVYAACSNPSTQTTNEICQFGKFKSDGMEKDAFFKKTEGGGIWCSDAGCITNLPKDTIIKDTSASTSQYYLIGGEGKALGPKALTTVGKTAPTEAEYNAGSSSSAASSTKPTTPPPKKSEPAIGAPPVAVEPSAVACPADKCEVIGGVTIPLSEKDNFYDNNGDWLVKEDENGNLAANDNSAVYSKDGKIKIGLDGKQYTLDNTNGQYSIQKGTMLLNTIGGAITSLGGQVVAPLKTGEYSVGGVKIDKNTYETLQSSAGNKQLSIDTSPGDHSISWGDNSVGGKIVQKFGITAITLNSENKEETKWSLPDGTMLKAKDGWVEDATSGKLNNKKEGKSVTVSVTTDGTTIINKEENEYFKTETVIKSNGDKEIKKYENNKLKSYTGKVGEETFEAEIEDGKIKYFEFKNAEGKRTSIVMGDDKEAGTKYTFKDKDGKLNVCIRSGNSEVCKNEEEADEAGGEWKTAMNLKLRESPSSWTRFAGGLLAVAQATKPYTGISLFINDVFEKDWRFGAEQWFASWSGERVISSAICERWYDKKPQGAAFVEDAFGNKRPVASIQAERSQSAITLVCDEASPCPESSECKKGLCYEPNSKIPQVAYVYKISWGVTAPSDLDLTPLKDEQGNRVSFNIKIGTNWLYERDGATAGAIKLKQGASDKDFMARYSLNSNIEEVCVIWDMAPKTKTNFGGEESVDDVCNEVETSTLETWDFGGASAGSGTSASVSSGEVKPIGGFLK